MRVTGIGHAGLYVETAAGSVLCDPWATPAYFASWFPFPDNSGLDWHALGRCDYLYVSHLHRDHYDPDLLRRHVARDATVLLPDYPTDDLRRALEDIGFRSFVQTRDGEPVEVGGLRVMIVSLTSPADGPIGDSALALDDGQARLFNMNDARPVDLEAIRAFGQYDAHCLQFSGAIWYPMVYDLPPAAKTAFARQKRVRQMDRACRYIEAVGARHVFPTAGPPCFLDDDLWELNDFDCDEANIFPDQTVFLDHMNEHGLTNGHLLIPGTVATLGGEGSCTIEHPIPGGDVRAIFTDKRAYLSAYRERQRPVLAAMKESWRNGDGGHLDDAEILTRLQEWWQPLLAEADRICEGVGGPVLFQVGDELPLVIDFTAREVRRWDGEKCRYRFRAARELVESCILTPEIDWVNSLFLSCRFQASRIGQYNEYVYTFFKCLTKERVNYADGWYDEQDHGDEDITLDGWQVQRRCPHLKADLSRFGVIDDGVLTCQMHGWRFDLDSGRCLTAAGHPLRAQPQRSERR